MKTSMTLETLLETVIAQKAEKRDLVTSTQDNIRMVQMPETKEIKMVLLRNGAEQLEELNILENAHRQIASRLQVPTKYYFRLLQDHPDLVTTQVNALFEREPEMRMIRLLGNNVRAFLSDRYARMDNYELLTDTLPSIVNNPVEHVVMSSHVNEHNMYLKVIYTDESLSHEITTARGKPRIMRPGFRVSNSETGKGSLKVEGFFFDSYCTNGCVFGKESAFTMSHTHLGGRVIEGTDFEVISKESDEKRRDLIKSEVVDAMKTISDPQKVEEMANILRFKANTENCKQPIAAVDLLIKELPVNEAEKDSVLETFLRDGDFSQYGLASAVTEQANKTENYERIVELENIGGKILDLNAAQWNQFVNAEKVAA